MNITQEENKKLGTSEWILQKPARNREIEGYASHTSINKGEDIKFYINTHSEKYSVSFFRMGWYQGMGGRQIDKSILLNGEIQKIPVPDKNSGLVECNWNCSYILKTTLKWVSGVYLVKLIEHDTNNESYIIFVVRDDYNETDILFQLPVTTYQAYNYWGGKCLYTFGSGSLTDWGEVSGEKAKKVSFNRPYASSNNPKAAYGMGAGDFLTNTRPVTSHKYPISSAGWDYNMVRWIEKNGYNVKYCTNIDIHENKEIYNFSKTFISNGHDEYWSYEMRRNITKARDSGINLAFFSSNTMYWQIRLVKSSLTNSKNRTIVCYKEAELDPVKTERRTINFDTIPEIGTQAKLIGVQYFADPVLGDIKITNPKHWIFNNSDIKEGEVLKGLLGYEIDGIVSESPSNIIKLSSTICQKVNRRKSSYILSHMFKRLNELLENNLKHIAQLFRANEKVLKYLILSICVIIDIVVLTYIGLIYFTLIHLLFLLVFFVWFLKIRFSEKYESNMSIYSPTSDSYVFATGSMQWSWGLDNYNAPNLRPEFLNPKVEIITKNILRKFTKAKK